MKQSKLLFLLIAALAFDSCRPTAQQTVADAEQPTDSTEAVTSADTLRLVITDKHLAQTDFLLKIFSKKCRDVKENKCLCNRIHIKKSIRQLS